MPIADHVENGICRLGEGYFRSFRTGKRLLAQQELHRDGKFFNP
jgi:hypothetical protein